MSREIKFRGWDGKNMFIIDVLALSECAWSCPDYNHRGVSMPYQPQITVMQFTGLKDKNRKNIYEGDVIKSDTTGALWEIKFGRTFNFIGWYGSHIDTKEKVAINFDFDNDNNSAIEVVGNIYENPELISPI